MNASAPKWPFRTLCAWAFWGAALFALVMALLPHPPQIGTASDKVQHILAFAVLAGLAALAWPQRLLLIGLGLFAFGGLIELLQMIPSLHRDGQTGDWIADTAATVTVLALAGLLNRMTRPTA